MPRHHFRTLLLRSLLVQQATAKGNSAVPETPKESENRAASTPEGNWARTKVTSDRTKQHTGKSVGAMTSNLVAKPSGWQSKWRNT